MFLFDHKKAQINRQRLCTHEKRSFHEFHFEWKLFVCLRVRVCIVAINFFMKHVLVVKFLQRPSAGLVRDGRRAN